MLRRLRRKFGLGLSSRRVWEGVKKRLYYSIQWVEDEKGVSLLWLLVDSRAQMARMTSGATKVRITWFFVCLSPFSIAEHTALYL